jgi:hypothetical protein
LPGTWKFVVSCVKVRKGSLEAVLVLFHSR